MHGHMNYKSDILTRLRAGRSGFRIPIGLRALSLLRNLHTDPGPHPASC
jgi:hypothetical protein